MNKRKENLGKFLITMLITLSFYGPIVVLYLADAKLGVGFILGMVWVVLLIFIAMWFDTDPDEEEKENEVSETSTNLDLTDEEPETPPKFSIDEVGDRSEAMQISTGYSLSIMTKMDRNSDLL